MTGNALRVWGNLTTSNKERRVTHVAGYASVNGSNYRRAFLMPYGAATFSEGLATNQLTIAGNDGNYLPPSGAAFGVEFAGRMWYLNTPEHPYRAWRSDPGEPQYVGVANFLDTTDRDEITGAAVCQGVLIVFTIAKAYVIRASGNTFLLDRLDSSFGCLSHFGILELHNKLWFPTQDGVAIYDGAGFYFVMKDLRPYWQRDYLEHQEAFRDSFAVNEKIGKNYMLLIPRTARDAFEDWSPGLVSYVGNYLNFERSIGGQNEQPDWSLDLRNRIDYSGFYGLDNRLYFGGEDGALRVEDSTDADDDADTIAKALLIEHGVQLFQEPGDDVEGGKTLSQLWAYVESELNAWSAYAIMGDEWIEDSYQPDNVLKNWKTDVSASALEQPVLDPEGGEMLASYVQETVHNLGGPEGISGRGLLFRVRATAPVGMKYRGHGGIWKPAGAPRIEKEITRFIVYMDGVPIVPNTAATRISIAALGGQVFHVVLNNADLVTYPISVNMSWAGAFTGSDSDPIASGLTSAPGVAFNVTAGQSTLEVFVGSGILFAKKTFYFTAA
jgi:hypothetical protein